MFIRIVLLLVSLALLSGCAITPSQMGISQAQWNQYSEQQRQQIKENYRQAQEVKHDIHVKKGHSQLAVQIQGGQVLMPPYTSLQPYKPASFTIRAGECNVKVPLVSVSSSSKTDIKVCYTNDVLYFDPSLVDPNFAKGGLQFAYMPVWVRGFTYSNISSMGFTKLTNATIFVKEIAS